MYTTTMQVVAVYPFRVGVLRWAFKSSSTGRQKVLGGIIARALAYGKSVGFIMLRKIREP